MKKKYLYMVIGIVILILIGIIFFRGFSGEDDWIKDSRGVWVRHGNPANAPDYVIEQQKIIDCALGLYNKAKENKIDFNSQCLGRCTDYSIDIVHVPRTSEDNLLSNQCSDYRNSVTHYFIELDKNGEIVRVA